MDKFLVLIVVLVIVCLFEWWIYDRYLKTNTLTESQKNNARTNFCIILALTIGFSILIYMYGLSHHMYGAKNEEYGFFGKKKEVQKVPETRATYGNPMKKPDYTAKGVKVEAKTDTSKFGILKGTKR